MNKTIYFLITIITINSAYSQSLFLLGGIAQTSPNFSYAESGKSFATNVYSIPKIKPSLTIGYTILEKENFSIQAMLHYNQLSGSIANDNVGRSAKASLYLLDNFVINQISLSPLVNIFPMKTTKYKLGIFMGPKLDYILSTSRFVDPYNYVLHDKYNANMKNIVFSSQIGLSFDYKLSPKFGIITQLSYHYPITEIVNHQEFDIYTYTNPFRQDYIEISNMRTSVRFLQAQVGLSYHLSKTTK